MTVERVTPGQGTDARLSLLMELEALFTREGGVEALMDRVGRRLARALHAERATLYIVDPVSGELRSLVADLPELSEIRLPRGRGVAGVVAATGESLNVADVAREPRHFSGVDRATGFVTRSLLAVPVKRPVGSVGGVLQVLNRKGGPFTTEDEAYLRLLAQQMSNALSSVSAPLLPEDPFECILSSSPEMRAVCSQGRRVAPTEATVLLRGETGVGKGLFARALHEASARRGAPFVTLDCTTLPESLAESELFGHERGAFTGADRQRPGRLELADGGTLFIDEVGDLPLVLQMKLLRFLQERTFERVGGQGARRVDVRVIAATHRDLAMRVRAGTFRQDLFYRLRVVELKLPNLRMRGPADIVLLASHFLQRHASRHGRSGLRFSEHALRLLSSWTWPGNVRELENAVERAVVLSHEPVLTAESLALEPPSSSLLSPAERAMAGGSEYQTAGSAPEPALPAGITDLNGSVVLPLGLSLEEVEQRYLEATLRAAQGNQSQAARALKVGRNTVKRKLDVLRTTDPGKG